MASLTGQTISSTYDSLLKVSDNEPLTATLKQITDGLGNNSALSLSTADAQITGDLVITGALDVTGAISGSNLSGSNTGDETYASIIAKLGFTPIGGSGIAGRVSRFSDSDELTSTNIYIASDETIGEMVGIGGSPNDAPSPHRLYVTGNSYFAGDITSTGGGTFAGNMRSLRAWVGPSTWSSGSAPIHAYTDSIGANPLLRLQNGGSVNSNELSTIWLENYAGFRGELTYTSNLDSNRLIFNNTSSSGRIELQIGSTEFVRLASNGAVGIGSTSLTGYNLRIGKTITGAVTSVGISVEGNIQSSVTTRANLYSSYGTVVNTVFTLPRLSHFVAFANTSFGSATVTTQEGFLASSDLTGATNNYGFRGQIASGTNRFNLYMDGTADNYLVGNLGIGTTTLTGFNLRIDKELTGATATVGCYVTSNVNISSTASAHAFSTNIGTNANVISAEIVHYRAAQKAFGSGTAITNQIGFASGATLTGATNNYAFYSSLASGTNRWNLYMVGTARNYLAGVLAIGTTSPNASAMVQIDSTTQGFLPPRMTSAQRTAIATPAVGLVVYQTDGGVAEGLYVYKSTGWSIL